MYVEMQDDIHFELKTSMKFVGVLLSFYYEKIK